MTYVCPICAEPLHLPQSGKSYLCCNKHQFDQAKQGYLNLLPVQHKASKQPGDNKEMLQARRLFLEAGYYQPLVSSIRKMLTEQALPKPLRMLDLGCGEGYYSRQLAEYLVNHVQAELHGLDISKAAIAAAAKKQPQARFVVASSQRLPYPEHHFDLLLRVFAPANEQEILRVLKPGGLLLTVSPGPRHLWQLKQRIYALVNEHSAEAPLAETLMLLNTQRVSTSITPTQQHRLALLQMTPFAWRANVEQLQAINDATDLAIEIDFIVSLARKN